MPPVHCQGGIVNVRLEAHGHITADPMVHATNGLSHDERKAATLCDVLYVPGRAIIEEPYPYIWTGVPTDEIASCLWCVIGRPRL